MKRERETEREKESECACEKETIKETEKYSKRARNIKREKGARNIKIISERIQRLRD